MSTAEVCETSAHELSEMRESEGYSFWKEEKDFSPPPPSHAPTRKGDSPSASLEPNESRLLTLPFSVFERTGLRLLKNTNKIKASIYLQNTRDTTNKVCVQNLYSE